VRENKSGERIVVMISFVGHNEGCVVKSTALVYIRFVDGIAESSYGWVFVFVRFAFSVRYYA